MLKLGDKNDKSIDDLCPAAYNIFGLKKSDKYICKDTAIPCYTPGAYKGCFQYQIHERTKGIKEDYKINKIT